MKAVGCQFGSARCREELIDRECVTQTGGEVKPLNLGTSKPCCRWHEMEALSQAAVAICIHACIVMR